MTAPTVKQAIKSADFLPKQLTARDASVQDLLLGTLIGVASGIARVPNPKDATEIMEGLKGRFRFTYASGTLKAGDVLEAPTLWAPELISGEPIRILNEAETNGELLKLDMAWDVYATRSSAALGYTWLAKPLFEVEPAPNDPLAAIMARVTKAPALTDQSEPVAKRGRAG